MQRVAHRWCYLWANVAAACGGLKSMEVYGCEAEGWWINFWGCTRTTYAFAVHSAVAKAKRSPNALSRAKLAAFGTKYTRQVLVAHHSSKDSFWEVHLHVGQKLNLLMRRRAAKPEVDIKNMKKRLICYNTVAIFTDFSPDCSLQLLIV